MAAAPSSRHSLQARLQSLLGCRVLNTLHGPIGNAFPNTVLEQGLAFGFSNLGDPLLNFSWIRDLSIAKRELRATSKNRLTFLFGGGMTTSSH